MKKIRYAVACIVLFAVGAYIWKIKNAGLAQLVSREGPPRSYGPADAIDNAVLFEVGKEVVTQADIDWEYRLILSELATADTTASGEMASKGPSGEFAPLKKKLASALIERKVLFAFIERDTSFNLTDPARYTACLAEWQTLVEGTSFKDRETTDRKRLKARLCERSLLEQYLEERLFQGLAVSDLEINRYYTEHKSQFRQFESVSIRHILFVDEPSAKKWRSVLTVQNFTEMARAHSITPEGKMGGRLGPYVKGMLPAVFDIAFHMKPGEISDVLRSNYGYHVILLEEKTPKTNLDLAHATPEIAKVLRRQKRERAYDQWLEQALASVKVSVPKTSL